MTNPNIKIPVDLTNPGQFFACCGLLELADRLWPGAEGWFSSTSFCVLSTNPACSLGEVLKQLSGASMEQLDPDDDAASALRLQVASPILLNWWRDEESGGKRFKTWAGRQTVLAIFVAMRDGLNQVAADESSLWNSVCGGGLPFNFDSDLGGQGSALDIGFSFDPLAASEVTRIEGTCKPALELLCFIGMQRFRPRELKGENRFVYMAWQTPLPVSIAAAVACQAIRIGDDPRYEFRLLYRTKYLKSFLPAILFQGDRYE